MIYFVMNIFVIFILFAFCRVLEASFKETNDTEQVFDYCTHPDCPLKNMHTLCIAANKWSPRLYASGLTSWMRYQLLLLHNRQRDNVALGLEPGQPPASNMRKLYWDKELEASAVAWASQCPARHDECRHTLRFPALQNIDVRPVVPWMTEAQLLSDAVASWFSGSRVLPPDRVWAFQLDNCSGPTGCLANRYSAAVWGSTWRLGCSQALCTMRRRSCVLHRKKRNEDLPERSTLTENLVRRTSYGVSTEAEKDDGRPALHRGRGKSGVSRRVRVVAHTVCNYGPAGNAAGLPMYAAGAACGLCPRGTACTDRTHRALCALNRDPDSENNNNKDNYGYVRN